MHKINKLPKNILFVTRDVSYAGGTEQFIFNFLIYISKYFKNTFLLETDSHGKYVHLLRYKQLEDNGVTVIKGLQLKGNTFCDLKKVAIIQGVIRNYKINIVHSFLFNADFLVYLARIGSKKAENIFNKNKITDTLINIDKTYLTFKTKTIEPLYFKWFSSKFCDFSVALEHTTDKWVLRKEIIDNILEKLISKYSDGIIVASGVIKKRFIGYINSPTSIIKVIPCTSISKDELFNHKNKINKKSLLNSIGINSNSKLFIVISRLEPGKGIEDVVFAFKALDINASLIILGDGSLSKKLTYCYRNIKQIYFLGFKYRDDLMKILNIVDCLILPSHSEGLPLVIQEAMLSKKPIIAAATGGVPDLVKNNVNGYLYDHGDTTKLIFLIKKIFNLPDTILKKMGDKSFRILKNNFINEQAFQNYLNFYLK